MDTQIVFNIAHSRTVSYGEGRIYKKVCQRCGSNKKRNLRLGPASGECTKSQFSVNEVFGKQLPEVFTYVHTYLHIQGSYLFSGFVN